MPFAFDEKSAPDFEHWQQSVRFWMLNGDQKATCQIGFSTLRDLGPDMLDTAEECENQFRLHRGQIVTAAARLLKARAHLGETVVQVLRANLL